MTRRLVESTGLSVHHREVVLEPSRLEHRLQQTCTK